MAGKTLQGINSSKGRRAVHEENKRPVLPEQRDGVTRVNDWLVTYMVFNTMSRQPGCKLPDDAVQVDGIWHMPAELQPPTPAPQPQGERFYRFVDKHQRRMVLDRQTGEVHHDASIDREGPRRRGVLIADGVEDHGY